MLFASQATAAIANARTHRSEQRARVDLEALVETSPVGVLVFDAKSGGPVSLNREARRIVESVHTPGRSLEDLLEIVSFRRAGGQDVSRSELPLPQWLSSSQTVRAEEIVTSTPDGRSVRMLVNATPIRAQGDEVRSVVVTMQDLAPLDEIERMRTDFLGLVSHELREPLTAVKGSAATLLEEGAQLDRAEMREFHRIIAEQARHMRGLLGDLLDAGRIDSGTLSVAPEPSGLADLAERARSTFLGAGGRHPVLVALPAKLPSVMADRQRIVQVLNNLFANAARHAPESSPIRVAAASEKPTSPSRSPTRGGGCRPSYCRRSSAGTLAARRARRRLAVGVGRDSRSSGSSSSTVIMPGRSTAGRPSSRGTAGSRRTRSRGR